MRSTISFSSGSCDAGRLVGGGHAGVLAEDRAAGGNFQAEAAADERSWTSVAIAHDGETIELFRARIRFVHVSSTVPFDRTQIKGLPINCGNVCIAGSEAAEKHLRMRERLLLLNS